jgi:hypothetical protein
MKSAIILDETLPSGLLANAAACITTGLFREQADAYGPDIHGADFTFLSITKVPILILKKGKRDVHEILRRIAETDLRTAIFTREGQSTASYDEYVRRVEGKHLADLQIIGIGLIGDDKQVTKVAGDLPLLR